LITLALVIIGDIVTLRERGRWTGLMGMVFALSAVLGPGKFIVNFSQGEVLGGVITDNISWRWIFYINIPIGIVALLVIQFSLKLPGQKRKEPILQSMKRIDYAGMFTILGKIFSVPFDKFSQLELCWFC
jgi:MFS family permease